MTTQVLGYQRKRIPDLQVLGTEELDLPARTLRTTAVWWTAPAEVLLAAGVTVEATPGALHAAEHASIGLLPLLATCDRWDLGGLSTALHVDTEQATVFVHDAYPGGAGFAERGFALGATWLRATRDAIAACRCFAGCPACVQSPKCGNAQQPAGQGRRDPPARRRPRPRPATGLSRTAADGSVTASTTRRPPHGRVIGGAPGGPADAVADPAAPAHDDPHRDHAGALVRARREPRAVAADDLARPSRTGRPAAPPAAVPPRRARRGPPPSARGRERAARRPAARAGPRRPARPRPARAAGPCPSPRSRPDGLTAPGATRSRRRPPTPDGSSRLHPSHRGRPGAQRRTGPRRRPDRRRHLDRHPLRRRATPTIDASAPASRRAVVAHRPGPAPRARPRAPPPVRRRCTASARSPPTRP